MFISIATTSEAFVPRTAAIKVPFFPWPSLLERKVNKPWHAYSHLYLAARPCSPLAAPSHWHAQVDSIRGNRSSALCTLCEDHLSLR